MPGENKTADRPSRGKLIAGLAIGIVVLYPLIGLFYKFHHGSASGNVYIDILWHVTWLFFCLAQFSLVVLLVIEARRHFGSRSGAQV